MPSWTISEGVITGFLLSPASTEDHRAAEAFLCWRANPLDAPLTPDEMPRRRNGKLHAGPNGPQCPRYGPGEASGAACYLGDNGFSGQDWQPRRAEDCGAEALAPRNYSGETGEHRRRWLRSQLQVIESVNGVLTGVFHLGFPRARSRGGLLTRLAAKVPAFNLGLWLNRHFGRPDLSFAALFSC